jgi:hypothetical protein
VSNATTRSPKAKDAYLEERYLVCRFCQRVFSDLTKLRRHIEIANLKED